MDSGPIIDVFSEGMYVAILMVSFIILPGLVVGLIIAMLQAATQVNEMSLSFIPKLLVTIMSVIFMAPWLHSLIVNFATNLYTNIPNMIS